MVSIAVKRSVRPATITARNLCMGYGDTPVLDDVSFVVEGGTSAAIIGPNGSGKTTLLNLIVRLAKPTDGSITTEPNASFAYVLQHRSSRLWLPLTAREVITTGHYGRRRLLGRISRSDRTTVIETAERLEVGDLLDRQFATLSGGQKQRVLLAQALVQDPDVLLLDEPITGLDLASQQRILDLIDDETEAGTTVVITTHNLDEARHCDTVLLVAGRLIACGSPNEVLTPELLRETFGARVLGDHRGHDHSGDLLIIDDHGHGH